MAQVNIKDSPKSKGEAIADGPVAQVMAGPVFSDKNNFHHIFYTKY